MFLEMTTSQSAETVVNFETQHREDVTDDTSLMTATQGFGHQGRQRAKGANGHRGDGSSFQVTSIGALKITAGTESELRSGFQLKKRLLFLHVLY